MKDKKHIALEITLFHIACFLLGSILFVLLFHTAFLAGMVLFYRGIVFLLFTGIVVFGVVVFLKRTRWGSTFLSYRDVVLAIVLVISLNLVFFTLVPVTADRSISVFLLGYMHEHASQTLTPEQFNKVFIDKYVYGNGATQKRFTEQLATGSIVKAGNGYKISPMGLALIRFFAFIANVFNVGKKNLSM